MTDAPANPALRQTRQPFTGYKGGDFTMTGDTPLWRASYGDTGEAIMDLQPHRSGSALILITKKVD